MKMGDVVPVAVFTAPNGSSCLCVCTNPLMSPVLFSTPLEHVDACPRKHTHMHTHTHISGVLLGFYNMFPLLALLYTLGAFYWWSCRRRARSSPIPLVSPTVEFAPAELCLSAYKSGDCAEHGTGARRRRQRGKVNARSRHRGSRAENMWLSGGGGREMGGREMEGEVKREGGIKRGREKGRDREVERGIKR